MNIKVLQKRLDYKNCPIVIRQLGENFEYITSVNGEIYSSYVNARKSLIRRLFLLPHTSKDVNRITNYMVAMAQTTIDTVLSSEQPAVPIK
jgi:hypothetical protein